MGGRAMIRWGRVISGIIIVAVVWFLFWLVGVIIFDTRHPHGVPVHPAHSAWFFYVWGSAFAYVCGAYIGKNNS
jgi:hypothetical protein